jgi:hypothetical protein
MTKSAEWDRSSEPAVPSGALQVHAPPSDWAGRFPPYPPLATHTIKPVAI